MPPNLLIKPVAQTQPPKPKPYNAFGNLGVEGSGYATRNVVPAAVPASVAPVAAPPPPPPNYEALTLADPQYTTGISDINRQNDLTMAQLLNAFKGRAQSYQDAANAHGALFSGAAVNAQRSAAQGYADQAAQQAQNVQSGIHNLHNNVWNRILQQFAGGS